VFDPFTGLPFGQIGAAPRPPSRASEPGVLAGRLRRKRGLTELVLNMIEARGALLPPQRLKLSVPVRTDRLRRSRADPSVAVLAAPEALSG
jgi:hypothetical protein